MRSEEDVKALVLKRSEDAFTQAGCKVVVLDVFFLFETSFFHFSDQCGSIVQRDKLA
jgi:hypothetical protein